MSKMAASECALCGGAIYVFLKGQYTRRCTLEAEGCHRVIHQPSAFMRLHLLAAAVNLPGLFLLPFSLLHQIWARHEKLVYFICGQCSEQIIAIFTCIWLRTGTTGLRRRHTLRSDSLLLEPSTCWKEVHLGTCFISCASIYVRCASIKS